MIMNNFIAETHSKYTIQLLVMDENDKAKTHTKIICRFCLKLVDKTWPLTKNITSQDGNFEINLFTAIADVVPEIFPNVSMDTQCCCSCVEKLKTAFFFRNACIQTELDITDCAASKGISCDAVKLCDVIFQKIDRFDEKNKNTQVLAHSNFYNKTNVQFDIDMPSKMYSNDQTRDTEICSDIVPSLNIQEIIENIPEIDDVEDTPDLLDLNSIVNQTYISNARNDRSMIQSNVLNTLRPVSKNQLFKVTPAQPFVLKKILLYPCKFCHRALKTSLDLEEHMSTHSVLRNACFKCSPCQLYIPKKLHSFHKSLHDENLSCPLCNIKFDSRKFVEHMKLHYPYEYAAKQTDKLCAICYHAFPNNIFELHLGNHKLGVPVVASNNLKCQICLDVFDFSNFEEHMKLHKK